MPSTDDPPRTSNLGDTNCFLVEMAAAWEGRRECRTEELRMRMVVARVVRA